MEDIIKEGIPARLMHARRREVEKILDDPKCYRREFRPKTLDFLNELSVAEQVEILKNKDHAIYDDVKVVEYRHKVWPKMFGVVTKLLTATIGDTDYDLGNLVRLDAMTAEEIYDELLRKTSALAAL